VVSAGQLSAELHTAEQGLKNLYNYFVTGEDKFFIYGETIYRIMKTVWK
jgi:hypothetical protein